MSTSYEQRPLAETGRYIDIQEKYNEHLAKKALLGSTICDLCEAAKYQRTESNLIILGQKIIELASSNFALIPNTYPYARYDGQWTDRHDMLVPIAHQTYKEVMNNSTHSHEYIDIMGELQSHYDLNVTRHGTNKASSIPGHMHTHLFKFKADDNK